MNQLISPTIPQVGRGGEDMDKYMGGVAYPRYGTHTVEVSLQWGEYKGMVIVQIDGNATGASVIDSALNSLADGDFEPNMNFAQNQRHIELIDSGTYEGFVKHYRLINELGHELHIDLDDIADCIVGVRIIGWEEVS